MSRTDLDAFGQSCLGDVIQGAIHFEEVADGFITHILQNGVQFFFIFQAVGLEKPLSILGMLCGDLPKAFLVPVHHRLFNAHIAPFRDDFDELGINPVFGFINLMPAYPPIGHSLIVDINQDHILIDITVGQVAVIVHQVIKR